MIVVNGRAIYSELSELVAAEHTALVLVDMQCDFMEPGGEFSRLGVDLSMYPAMRARLRRLLETARARGVFVLHLQMTSLPGRRSESPAQLRFNLKMHASVRADEQPLTYCVAESPGHAFVADLAPSADEQVVPKWRSSGFAGTNLDLLLRSSRIESLVIAGCTTEGCVESTARDALFHDYHVVIPADCVASDSPEQHEASLLLMRHRFDVVQSAEIIETWGAPVRGTRSEAVTHG